jgi:hypothetical protein
MIYTDIQVSQRSLVCSLPGIPQRQLAVETSEGFSGSAPSAASSSASASMRGYSIRAQVRVIVADQISARHSGAELTFGNVPALHICDNAGLSPVQGMQGWGGVARGTGGGVGGVGGDRARIGGRLDSSGLTFGHAGAQRGADDVGLGARAEGVGGGGEEVAGMFEIFGGFVGAWDGESGCVCVRERERERERERVCVCVWSTAYFSLSLSLSLSLSFYTTQCLKICSIEHVLVLNIQYGTCTRI